VAVSWRNLVVGIATLFTLGSGATLASDNEVVEAYRALQGHLDAERIQPAKSLLDRLRDTPLGAHATMAVLRADIDNVEPERVAQFLARHRDITGRDGFRVAWMRELADRAAWQGLATTYHNERDAHVRCAVVEARRVVGQTRAAIELALELWHVGHRQPQSCNKAFDLLEQTGELTSDRLRARMRLAMAAGHPGIVRAYLDRLPPDEQAIARNWLTVYDDPSRATDLVPAEMGSDAERRTVLVSALRKLARTDARRARNAWDEIQAVHSLPDGSGAIERTIALQAVYDGTDDGTRWLNELPDAYANSIVHAWRVRDALRGPDWPAVRSAIRGMTAEQANKSRWRYWRARALRAMGASSKAKRAFEELTKEFDYHGFLAADAVEAAYPSGDDLPAAEAGRQLEVATRGRLHRALLLHRAGHEAMATSVWRRAVNGFGESADRLAAARIAADHDWPWAAMFASGRGGHYGASRLRFPRGYPELVARASATNDISQRWIQALIRQESAFRNTACSSAGACGLTQLMPATGRWMLQQLGEDTSDLTASLLRPERNIPAGVGYLAYLRKRFDHPVVAIAAYNAGPGNVKRWLTEPVAEPGSPRWVESLTFGETREYTAQVVFNHAVYDLLASGRTKRLAAVMETQ